MLNLLGSATAAVDATAWKPVIDAMTAQINVESIIGVLTTLIVTGIGIVFMWWGVRKATASLMKAFRSGKISN